MERISLNAETRSEGKSLSRKLRAQDKVPAVLYGKGQKPVSISVNRKEVETAVKTKSGMNVLLELAVDGGKSNLALIRDYQADPFRRDFLHIDFQAISLDQKIDVEVPVILIGDAAGVKEGGVIEQQRRTLHVAALPMAIPDKIEVDISALMIGDSIHADEIQLPEGVEFPHAVNYPIVAIVPPAKEEVAAPVVAAEGVVAEGAEGAAPVVAEGAEKATPAEGDAKAKAPAAEVKKEGK